MSKIELMEDIMVLQQRIIELTAQVAELEKKRVENHYHTHHHNPPYPYPQRYWYSSGFNDTLYASSTTSAISTNKLEMSSDGQSS